MITLLLWENPFCLNLSMCSLAWERRRERSKVIFGQGMKTSFCCCWILTPIYLVFMYLTFGFCFLILYSPNHRNKKQNKTIITRTRIPTPHPALEIGSDSWWQAECLWMGAEGAAQSWLLLRYRRLMWEWRCGWSVSGQNHFLLLQYI